MLDEPIDVLDSNLRFVDAEKAAKTIERIGRADVPPEIAARDRVLYRRVPCRRKG